MSPTDVDAAARLIEALLGDPALRDRFRRDPVATCRAAGLDELADEMRAGAGRAMYTLDLRESKSSLAGVMMAAAVEGIAIWQVVEHLGDAGGLVSTVMSRVNLPAIGGDDAGAAPGSAVGSQGNAVGAPGEAVDPQGDGGGAPGVGGGSQGDAVASQGDAGGDDPAGSKASGDRPAAGQASADGASQDTAEAPGASPDPSASGGSSLTGGAGDAPSTARVTPTAAESTGAPAPRDASASAPDPGGGTPPSSDAAGSAPPAPDAAGGELAARLAASGLDAGAVASLVAASGGHDVVAAPSAAVPGAIEITAVDGEPVDTANVAARDLAQRLGGLTGAQRPTGIATPWAIGEPGFSTGPEVQDRLQVTFPAAAGAVAAGAAGGSMALRAIKAEPAGTERRARSLVLAVPEQQAEPVAAQTAAPPAPEPAVVTDFPGNDAPRSQMAAWLASEARKRDLPGELPVMAALVESGMKNLPGGHADSVGLFQMRVGIWNQGAYAGYPDKPELQVKWFLDTAEAVRKQRVARGLPVDDPAHYGEWIADVERPAEQYRGRYQERLGEAQGLLREASSASPAAPAGAPADAVAAPTLEPAVATAPAEPAAPASKPIDPSTLGLDGKGGTLTPEAKAALDNPKLHFDDVGVSDLKAGKIDPRVIAVLTRLSKDHEITVSCMCSDHSRLTAGGSVSNHALGRGVDIAAIDGQPVNPGNPVAREVAQELSSLRQEYRPDEIGSPWAIAGPGYFTDGGHQDHLHVGFKTEIAPDWRAPAEVDAPAEPTAVRAGLVAGAAAAPVSGSMRFKAVTAEQAGAAASDASRRRSLALPVIPDSNAVRAAVEPAAASSGAAAPATPVTGPAAGSPVANPAAAADVDVDVDAPTATSGGASAGPKARAALAEARKYLGTPYLWGGSSPKTGFDCSGLVQWAYAKQGIAIPRVTYDQIDAPNGKPVDRADLLPGDLVFFRRDGVVHHVGMSLGGDRFLHAPRTGDVVKESSLKEPYFAGLYAGGRRFDAAGTGPVTEAASSPDPVAVRAAESARIVDERAARDPRSMVFRAIGEQEAANHRHTVQFLRAIEPEEAKKVEAAADEALGAIRGAGGYPGDDAPREEMARWLGVQARKHGLPAELPVMAALVESNLKNLSGGHADSAGLFQMRVGIWDKGAYAGYRDQPDLQAKWFIDHAVAHKKARIAAGDTNFGRDASSWGEWIADVERPAAQYRGRYQLRLEEARRLLRGR